MAERGWIATLHPIHTVHGARALESTVAQGFVKHGFEVLLHRVVDGEVVLTSGRMGRRFNLLNILRQFYHRNKSCKPFDISLR